MNHKMIYGFYFCVLVCFFLSRKFADGTSSWCWFFGCFFTTFKRCRIITLSI